MFPILNVLQRSSNHWLLYFICQNYEKLYQEKIFSFGHILFLISWPVIYSTLKTVHFPQFEIKCLIVTECKWLLWQQPAYFNNMNQCSGGVNYTRYISVLRVRAKWCCINFETELIAENLSATFSINYFHSSVRVSFLETVETYAYCDSAC